LIRVVDKTLPVRVSEGKANPTAQILLTSLLTAHIKGHKQNEQKMNINMSHYIKKWNERSHLIESVFQPDTCTVEVG
jgi:hypothetical protein